jgi:hypothetical protein
MSHLTLGHRLARELSRRGNRRAFFATARYRELRRIDSVDDLATFLDRTGYRGVRASADVDEVAGDIVDQRNARGALVAGLFSVVVPVVGFLGIPAMLLWRSLWKDDR